MSGSINHFNNLQSNKPLPVNEKLHRLTLSIKDYICLNGFRIDHGNQLQSVFLAQVSMLKKNIVIRYSFFQQDYSLLHELLELTTEDISDILSTIFEEVYQTNYTNSRIVILP